MIRFMILSLLARLAPKHMRAWTMILPREAFVKDEGEDLKLEVAGIMQAYDLPAVSPCALSIPYPQTCSCWLAQGFGQASAAESGWAAGLILKP